MYTVQEDMGEYLTKALGSALDASQLLGGFQGFRSNLQSSEQFWRWQMWGGHLSFKDVEVHQDK